MNESRPCEISGQESWEGTFHGWTHVKDHFGIEYQLMAVVEDGRGRINYVEPYKLTFKDKKA